MEISSSMCLLCPNSASSTCSKCLKSFCSQFHLELHRDKENQSCFPFTIDQDEHIGRFLRATRNISAGEVIYSEPAVVVGPNHVLDLPICLVCHQQLSLDNYGLCSNCSFPMCPSCSHSSPECSALVDCGLKKDENIEKWLNKAPYQLVLPVRLALLRTRDPSKFALIERLMDHNEERRLNDPSAWQMIEERVVQQLRSAFDGDLVRFVVGVLETNAYEIDSRSGLRALWPISSIASHNCSPNTFHIINNDNDVGNSCVAAVDIAEGEHILTSYLPPYLDTYTRRRRLKEGWFFDCNCSRCEDRFEFDSQLGTLRCLHCSENQTDSYMAPTQPLSYDTSWTCLLNQLHVLNCEEAIQLLQELRDKVDSSLAQMDGSKSSIASLLSLHKELLLKLHPQHALLIELKLRLLPLLCRSALKPINDFEETELEEKKEMCQSVIAALDAVTPGFSKIKAKAMFEEMETSLVLMSRALSSSYSPETQALIESTAQLCRRSCSYIATVLAFFENRLTPFERWLSQRTRMIAAQFGDTFD